MLNAGRRPALMKCSRKFSSLVAAALFALPAILQSGQGPQQDFNQHLLDAQAASDKGDYTRAVRELRAALAIHPETRGAYYQLGYALLQTHDAAGAAKAFTRELDFPPPDPFSLYYLGLIQQDSGNRVQAVTYLERSLAAGEVLDVRQKLAGDYLALGRVEKAITFLQESVRVRPEDGSLHYLLGRAYQRKDRGADARKEFDAAARWKAKFQNEMIELSNLRQALKDQKQPEAETCLTELMRSTDYDILLATATILGAAGLHSQAASFLDKAIGISPAIPEAHYDLARAYIGMNRRADAKPELAKALELKSDFYEAELMLGTVLVDEGDADGAIQHLRAAAKIRADNPRLLLMLGLQYYQRNYFADAIETLKKAVVLQPENPDPRYLLTEAYYRNFEYEHALHCAEETVQRFPNEALAHYHLGAQLNNLSHLSEAKHELELAIATDRGLVEAQAMLGEVIFKMGDTADSVGHFRRALAIDPKLISAQTGLGKALIQLRQYPEAAAAMEEAIQIDPNVPSLHLYLSQAYRAIGKTDEAKGEAAIFSRLNQERAHARDLEGDRKYPN
jgi:tetratricopeptide (TPR) repeat protein